MNHKVYAVIGLGQFGMTVACTLAQAGCEVMAVDNDDEKIQDIAEKVTYAVRADVSEPGVLKSLGVGNADVAIIAVSENLEASITATMQVVELGVPYVIAKAAGDLQGRILKKIGATQVIFPEHAMGYRVARNILTTGLVDAFELSPNFSVAQFIIPEEWVGKTLKEVRVREKYHINIIGIRKKEDIDVNVHPEKPLEKGCCLVAVGRNSDLNARPFLRKGEMGEITF